MARAKPVWRRVLTSRFLRWWMLRGLVRVVPPLGRRLGFFPRHIMLPEGADRVLADECRPITAEELDPHRDFLRKCAERDTAAPGVASPDGIVTGRRTAIYSRAWLDVATGALLLPERERTVLPRGTFANHNAISARLRRPRIRLAGRATAAIKTRNYFHLLLDNGIRLIDLIDSGLVADAPLAIVKQPDHSAVEAALYRALATVAPDVTVHQCPHGSLVEPDEAVVHFPPDNHWEWPPVTRAQAERLLAGFDAVYGPASRADAGDRLYLSRAGSKLRNPVNSAALEKALVERGFQPFVAGDGNHPEQIARFRAAKIVVAVHGAGLTNLLFCTPGARVIEIFPANFVKSPYWRLADRMGLEYRPVIGGPGDYDQRFAVDVGAVLAAIGDSD